MAERNPSRTKPHHRIMGILEPTHLLQLWKPSRIKRSRDVNLISGSFPVWTIFEECHLLFISGSEKNNIRNVLASIKNHNILTVSDMDRFAQQGGMIGLVNIEGKISFEVNIDTVQHSRLKFSSQLLKLAKIVHTGP